MVRKVERDLKDWRSTGRRRARNALFESKRPYRCVDCGATSISRPKEVPGWVTWFDEIWPKENRTVTMLQADHENKDWTDNDPANLNWRCPSDHRIHDNLTEPGVSTVGDDSGYLI